MRKVKLFISSPGDLEVERRRIADIVDLLNGEFSKLLSFEVIRWEDSVYQASASFQQQIPEASECDIVVGMLWSRLGTPLPDSFERRMPDDTPYPSGTAYEILSALERRRETGKSPDVYVFRKTVLPVLAINDAGIAHAQRQWDEVESFFQQWFETADKRILRVAEKFTSTDELARKVELLLRDWIASNVPQGVIWPIEVKGSPFRSLEPFDAKHADVFCGRDRKVARAIDELKSAALQGTPFLLIPGASGAGKSSLMRAGIAPRLTRPGVVQGVEIWRVAVMRPGEAASPFEALARALFVSGTKADDPGGFGKALPELASGSYVNASVLASALAGVPEAACAPIVVALDQVAREVQRAGGYGWMPGANLLLLVDQFEDIFARGQNPEDRGRFFDLLTALARTGRVWIVATLRGDFYARVLTERRLMALKDAGGQFDLLPPGADELDEIVHRSAEAAGLTYEADANGRRLDDLLLADAAGENTLPLLQFALDLLFKKCCLKGGRTLTFAAYEAIGGLDGALDKTAERALVGLVAPNIAEALDDDSQFEVPDSVKQEIERDIEKQIKPVLARLLRQLAAPADREQREALPGAPAALTTRVIPLEAAIRDEASRRLVDALLQARILLAPQSKDGPRLRLAHDRVLTGWQRARDITDENEEFYRVQDYVEKQLARWVDSGRLKELLIPPGLPLSQAEQQVRAFPDEFPKEVHEFVALSGRGARLRRRVARAAVAALVVLTLLTGGTALVAIHFGEQARSSYEAARDTVGSLVSSLGERLRDVEGIRVETIDDAFQAVNSLVENLRQRSQGGADLDRIAAKMHYELAKTLRETRSFDRALQEARKALELLDRAGARQSQDPAWRWDRALSLEQIGDIRRDAALALQRARDPGAGAAFAEARAAFTEAQAIRRDLRKAAQEEPKYAYGIALIRTRMGDLSVNPDKAYGEALEAYREAAQEARFVFRKEPDKADWQRELSWSYRKLGEIADLLGNHAEALDHQQRSLCIRRYMSVRNDRNMLYKRDVAFSMERLSDAMRKTGDHEGAKRMLFESLVIRRDQSTRDPGNLRRRNEVGQTLFRIGELYHHDQPMLAVGFYLAAAAIGEDNARLDSKLQQATGLIKDAHDRRNKAMASLRAKPDALIPTDDALRASAQAEEATFARLIGASQDNPLTCWNQLMQELGVPQHPARTAGMP